MADKLTLTDQVTFEIITLDRLTGEIEIHSRSGLLHGRIWVKRGLTPLLFLLNEYLRDPDAKHAKHAATHTLWNAYFFWRKEWEIERQK